MKSYGPLFATATEREREEVLQRLDPFVARPLDILMEQGHQDPALVYLLEGRVEVLRNGLAIDNVGPGEVVGEMSLFTGRPRSATVRALEACRFLIIDR